MTETGLRFYGNEAANEYMLGTKGHSYSAGQLGFAVVSFLPRGSSVQGPRALKPGPFAEFALEALLRVPEASGFVAISPLTDVLRSGGQDYLATASTVSGSGFISFELSQQELIRHFRFRHQLVTYEEWAIGAASRDLKAPPVAHSLSTAVFWDLDYLLGSQPDAIQAVSVFRGELGEHLVLIRPHAGLVDAIERLERLLGKS